MKQKVSREEIGKKLRPVFHIIFFVLPDLGIFHIGKRVGYYVHWEPIYIGTHADPHYDERLSWEGKSDKMTQVRIE
jgi:hypothetical protein